jgi:hypothetical protein
MACIGWKTNFWDSRGVLRRAKKSTDLRKSYQHQTAFFCRYVLGKYLADKKKHESQIYHKE